MKKGSLKIYIVLISLFINTGIIQMQSQWTQWRGNNRDGICHEENLLKEWPIGGPKRLWAVNTVGLGFASATVYENVIYTTGKIDSVEVATALDMNGVILWQKAYGRAHKGEWPDSRCTPTFYKGMIYVYTGYGDLACLNAKTGDIIWQLQSVEKLGAKGNDIWGISESPLVVDDKVIITTGGKQASLFALNYLNGEIIWKTESMDDPSEYVNPVLIEDKDKKIIVAGTLNYTFAVDLSNGKIIWKEKAYYGYIPLPVNKSWFFIAGSSGGKMFSYNAEKNEVTVVWSDTIPSETIAGQVIIGNRLYGISNSGLYCSDVNTGNRLFTYPNIKNSSLIATADRIYAYNNGNGKVSLLKFSDTNVEIIGSFRVTLGAGYSFAHLSIGNGILFARHGTFLLAYDIKQQ